VLKIGDQTVRRPRRFLSFGDPLHDELLAGWLPKSVELIAVDVVLREQAAFWSEIDPGPYLLELAHLDSGSLLDDEIWKAALERIVQRATSLSAEARGEILETAAKSLWTALRADRRWIRSILRSHLILDLLRWNGTAWLPVPGEIATRILDPIRRKGERPPVGRPLEMPEKTMERLEAELARLRERRRSLIRQAWSHRLPTLATELEQRLYVVRIEGEEAVQVVAAELDSAKTALSTARESENPGLTTRAKNRVAMVEGKLAATRELWAQRVSWLVALKAEVTGAEAEPHISALINLRRPGI
jgi:ribosomal protein L18